MHDSATPYVIKNSSRQKPERFDPEKLHKSIASVCLGAGSPSGYAESIARKVTAEVLEWLKTRPEVTSSDLRRTAAKHLRTYHPDASYLYEHHRSTL